MEELKNQKDICKIAPKRGRPRKGEIVHVDPDYGHKYYANNKTILLQKSTEKIPCPTCQKLVSRANLKKHQARAKCLKQRNKLKEMFEDLKRISNNFNIDGSVYDKFIKLFDNKNDKQIPDKTIDNNNKDDKKADTI